MNMHRIGRLHATRIGLCSFGLLLAMALLLTLPSVAWAAGEQSVSLEFVAWSAENKLVALKVDDVARGTAFSVRELKTAKEIDYAPFTEDTEKRVWKALSRKHKLTDKLHTDQASESGEITLMAKNKKGAIELVVMQDGEVGTLKEIALPVDSRTKEPAKGTLKATAWCEKDKWVLVIINHELPGDMSEVKDTLHVIKYRNWYVDWQ